MSLDQPSEFVKPETPTRDAFLSGRLQVYQPRNGFRAGLDSVLLGAAINPASLSVLDLGAGVGTASLVALRHNANCHATLVELNPDMALLAKHNITENGFSDRATIISLDVAAKGVVRAQAGLLSDHFSTTIANPPFFSAGTLASDGGRAGSRHMGAAMLDLWVKTAAASTAPGGEIIFIYPADSLPQLLASFAQRFGGITLLPLLPRPAAPASRLLIRAQKACKAPLTLLPGRALHPAEGRQFCAEFDAIFRGEARLVW